VRRGHPSPATERSDGDGRWGPGGSGQPGGGVQAARPRTTREWVLAVALEQLDVGGEAAVRVDQISAESGASIGSIYHHFGDREGVIAAGQLRRAGRWKLGFAMNDLDGGSVTDEMWHHLVAPTIDMLLTPH
jgi:AcrR family transcriptional regulator